jgi:periplasmic divalent cation tolerance protein
MSEGEFVILYSTFPDGESAGKAAHALIEAELAACVNISGPMTSVYRWQGKIETASEVSVFVKTRRALADRAIAIARAVHPYDLPCFLTLPIIGGDVDYLDWIRRQTRSGG